MNAEQILSASFTKAEKARKLYDLGYSRHQVADMICGGNYGWAHNIYKKHFGLESRTCTLITAFNKEFGVEIEGYGIDRHELARLFNAAGIATEAQSYNHNTTRVWKIVTDGSLAGSNPFEVVSPILKGEQGMAELKKVCDVLEAAGVKINKSCGLHVHFNARQMAINDWRNLYKNYITMEGEIDSLMPISRRGNSNTYCRSMMSRFRSKENAFAAIDEAQTVGDLSRVVTGRDRYFKLNAESFTRHGTVEFRQHSGTIEFKKITSWIRICSSMIDKSATGVASQLEEFLNDDLKVYIRERKQKMMRA